MSNFYAVECGRERKHVPVLSQGTVRIKYGPLGEGDFPYQTTVEIKSTTSERWHNAGLVITAQGCALLGQESRPVRIRTYEKYGSCIMLAS